VNQNGLRATWNPPRGTAPTSRHRCGEVPDIVLFYDGINDVFSSHRNGRVGISTNEWARRAEFNLNRRPQQLARIWAREVLVKHHFRGFRRLARELRYRIRPSAPLHTKPKDRASNDELARQIVRLYEANLAIVESLGRSYGFDPLFYWQPAIFSKRYRSPFEQSWTKRASFLEPMYDAIYRRIRQSETLNSRPRFHNIDALLDDLEEPYYWDYAHVSEAGNQRVDDVIALIERRRTAAEGKAIQ